MNSKILSAIGLDIDLGIFIIILFVLIIILFVVLFVLLTKYGRIRASYEAFMEGSNAKSLEYEIKNLFDDINMLKVTTDKNMKDIKRIITGFRDTYQRVGIVKYDAFK